MKKLTIKTRLTIWFGLWMALIGSLVLVLLFSVGQVYVKNQAKSVLTNGVEDLIQNIQLRNSEIKIDNQYFFVDGLYISVYDDEGYYICGQVPRSFDNDLYFTDGIVRDFKSTTNNSTWHLFDTAYYVEGYGSIWIRAITSSGQFESAVHTMLGLSGYLVPIILLLSVLGCYVIVNRALKPVKQLTQTTKQIQSGNDLSKRIELGTGKDEIYILANTIDEMFNRLETAFENEKQFTSDASHELRTPIAVIISQCEYALEKAKTKQEYQEALAIVLEHTQKMSQLVNHLLTLSRINQNTYNIEQETIDFSELVEMSILPFTEEENELNISIVSKIKPNITLTGDQTLLMRLVGNLVENSIKYGKQNGETIVSLTDENDIITLSVKDNGIGIDKKDQDKIFNRFYQVNTSRNDGLGLGLAMSKWIANVHNASITVESDLGQGSNFIIIFKNFLF